MQDVEMCATPHHHDMAADPRVGKLASELFGLTGQEAAQSSGLRAYGAYLESRISAAFTNRLTVFEKSITGLRGPKADSIDFLLAVCRIYQGEDLGDASIDDLLEHYCRQLDYDVDEVEEEALDAGRQCTFHALMTLSMIYEPVTSGADAFEIKNNIALRHSSRRQPVKKFTKRPVSGLIKAFGGASPSSIERANDAGALLIYGASLNYDSLLTIGKINVDWTDTLSAHLAFSPGTRTISVYNLPTTCALACRSGKQSATLERYI